MPRYYSRVSVSAKSDNNPIGKDKAYERFKLTSAELDDLEVPRSWRSYYDSSFAVYKIADLEDAVQRKREKQSELLKAEAAEKENVLIAQYGVKGLAQKRAQENEELQKKYKQEVEER